MIKKLIKNLNYGFKETIITFFVILILFIVAIQQSRFKSSNEYKGKVGEILELNRKSNRVKIKSISMIKKHTKPTKENKGGIISKESFIHQSNIKNVDVKKTVKKEVSKK